MQVHDYVRNYLGEGKDAKEFAKQFLEKRSQFKNKARMEKRQEEVTSYPTHLDFSVAIFADNNRIGPWTKFNFSEFNASKAISDKAS